MIPDANAAASLLFYLMKFQINMKNIQIKSIVVMVLADGGDGDVLLVTSTAYNCWNVKRANAADPGDDPKMCITFHLNLSHT